MILGFSGYARSGKDTAAGFLLELGWKRIAFADKLRSFLYRLNPILEQHQDPDFGLFETRITEVIDFYGWDGYKESKFADEIRGLLQRLGTECGRQILGDNVWVNAALYDTIPSENYVITDVRFPNEAKAIRDRGGRLVRINRPGIGPINNHPSETSLDDFVFDYYIQNDDTLEALQRKVLGLSCV